MLQFFTKKKKSGFTLVELLVVIAVIGMLATIVLVSMGGARKRARDARGQSDLRQIMTAFEMKYAEAEVYPLVQDTFVPIPVNNTILAPYLSPTPRTNGGRIYEWKGEAQKFCIVFEAEGAPTTTWHTCSHRGCASSPTKDCPGY